MLFSSGLFFVFFLVVFLGCKIISGKYQNLWLLISSYLFYCNWNYRFLLLILFTSSIDFIAIKKLQEIEAESRRKQILFFSLGINFLILIYFKSKGLFSENSILPLGLSFYTFQSTSYVIDVYKRKFKAPENVIDFFLYISFFPQLISGPISRASELMPQILNTSRKLNLDLNKSLWLISLGLFKKVYIADNITSYLSWATQSGSIQTGIDAWVSGFAFTLRYYCDFSGYSDMAVGIALILGFNLPMNFNLPLFSDKISNVWNRWHITLGLWFKDYVHIPFFKNQKKIESSRVLTPFVTMSCIGLWHGINLNFFLWGLGWGALLAFNKEFDAFFDWLPKNTFRQFLKRYFTFFIWIFMGAFFAYKNVFDSFRFQKLLLVDFNSTPSSFRDLTTLLFFSVPLLLIEWLLYRKQDLFYFVNSKRWWVIGVFVLILILTLSGGQFHAQEFIYFQF